MNVIKEYRIRCGYTQQSLADRLGVSRQAVSEWERGISKPTLGNMVALGYAFNIPWTKLVQTNVDSGKKEVDESI